jgi:Fur family transcriptional regulator, peroxide stress response regulator
VRPVRSTPDREQISEVLAGAGLRSTPQRYAVMEFLMRTPVHATAEEVFEAVNRMDPRASRATIYNNLRSLVEARLVREVVADSRAARFEAHIEKHHHFICDQCGTVEDIAWFDVPARDRRMLGGRMVRDCELTLRGLCENCARAQK